MVNFSIQTRQKVGVLFPVPTPAAVAAPAAGLGVVAPSPAAVPSGVRPLKANTSVGFGTAEEDGYAVVSVLIISDQPFTATLFEGILSAGPFILTQTFAAALTNGMYVVAKRFNPIGSFLKMTIANTSGVDETVLNVLVLGVPIS